jgi:16S rRNA (guanine527-N7)-methyltransferase
MSEGIPAAMSADGASWQQALAAHALNQHQLAQFAAVLKVLEHDEHAPTAVRTAHAAAATHLADSLVALDVYEIDAPSSIADLGAGAGFPGLAIAVALPSTRVHLVESQRRKCEFLTRLTAAAEIENADVVCARAEEWREGLMRNDVVLARALAPQPVVLEYAAPLLRPGGALLDWRGKRNELEELAATAAAQTLGLELRDIRRVEPFAGAQDRHVHVFVKVAETPERFPRRAGIARKRPLGG